MRHADLARRRLRLPGLQVAGVGGCRCLLGIVARRLGL